MAKQSPASSLNGERVAVTGAAHGIGRQTALEAAERGASALWLIDRDADGLASLESELVGCEVQRRELDISSRLEVDILAAEWSEGSAPTILLNVAGIRASTSPLQEVTDAEWDAAIATNLTGTFLMTRAAALAMLARETRGVIVNIASTAGVIGYSNRAAYCASKFGVVGLTRAAALDLAPHGIRLFSVSPGFIHSGISDDIDDSTVIMWVPLRRRGDPRELASLIFDLVHSSFLTGTNIVVDGGALAGSLL
jgi:3alpha(or 20beta)-hydroxysteroid dehydrogenase